MVARTSSNPDDFCLPDLGEGLEEAELIEWCVDVGQKVQENDILAKMETAKALVEIPSPRPGVIAVLHSKPGQAVKVGAPLVTYRHEAGVEGGNGSGSPVEAPAQSIQRSDAGTVVGALQPGPQEKVQAAPAVRRLARDLGVDLENIAGSGIGGRITSQDVQAAADAGTPAPQLAEAPSVKGNGPAAPEAAPRSRPPQQPGPDEGMTRTPFRGVRRTIAEHLRYSVSHAVHFTVMDEADVTSLDHLRRRLVAASNEKVTLLPFVAYAVCRLLSAHLGAHFRRLNSTVDDDRQEIVQHTSVHLGVATDTESGLMVPVIRSAEKMGVLEISRRVAQLAKAARDRTIPPHQLTGSTFTISNFGSLGGRFGTPIINYPEAGILAVGRAREGVVARDGMLGVGKVLPLSLSADHRVIDGATAATALAKIIELLQTPEELLPPGGPDA